VASFLIDECVPRAVHEALAAAGHRVVLVREVLQGACDEDVLTFARGESLVTLTEDRRFGLIAMSVGRPCSVVVLLLGELSPEQKAARLLAVLSEVINSLDDAVTVVGPTRVRRRAL
jgi:predicted nuclease of predicted toxin-antitoxin system